VWGSHRQALEKSNRRAQIADGFSEQLDGDDMDIEEIPRAPATPGTEDISSSEGACLRFFWQHIFSEELAVGTQLLQRFGPNISSKAVRQALLSACSSMGDQYDRFALSGIEHLVLAIHYTLQAINEHAYVEILYAAVLMITYSTNEPDPDLSAEELANVILHHAIAYTFCLRNLSTVDVKEVWLTARSDLCSIWRWLTTTLQKLDFRNGLPKVFLRVNQFTKPCAQLMLDFNFSGGAECGLECDLDFLDFEADVQLYLKCWYHLQLLKDGDIEEINQLGSNIRDSLLFYHSMTLSTFQSKDSNGGDDDLEESWVTEMNGPFLEYAVLVEPSLTLSPDVRIRYRVLTVARSNHLDLWQSFLSALLCKSLPQDEGVFLVF